MRISCKESWRMHLRCSKPKSPATDTQRQHESERRGTGLDVLKVKLLNSIEQRSIAVVKNWSDQSACEMQI